MYLKTCVYHVHIMLGGVEAWHFEVQALHPTEAVAAACKALSVPECSLVPESRKHGLHLQFVLFFSQPNCIFVSAYTVY